MVNFNGKHNRTKGKVLLLLYSANETWEKKALSSREIVGFTGLSLASVWSLMSRLTRWEYVTRLPGRGCCRYRIAAKGRRFITSKVPVDVNNELVMDLRESVKNYG